MNWNELSSLEQLGNIIEESKKRTVAIFKHSTRCSISSTALDRFERNAPASDELKFYYLDLIKHRDISNKIASELKVEHQSPQVILLKDGKSIFDASHYEIDVRELAKIA